MIRHKKYILFSLFLALSNLFALSQKSQTQDIYLDDYFISLKTLDFDKAFSMTKNIENVSFDVLSDFTKIIKDNGQSDYFPYSQYKKESINKGSNKQLAFIYLTKGYYQLWYDNNRVESYSFLKEAYNYARLSKNKELIKYSLVSFLKFYRQGQLQNNDVFERYLNELEIISESSIDYYIFYSLKYQLKSQKKIYSSIQNTNDRKVPSQYYREQDSIIKLLEGNPLITQYYLDKGNFLLRISPEESIRLYNKGLLLIGDKHYFKRVKYLLKSNLARAYSATSKHHLALRTLNESRKLISKKDSLKSTIAYHVYASEFYAKVKLYDSAYYHSALSRTLGFKFKFQEQNTAVSKLRIELNTAEKEKENLILTADKKRNQNIAIGLGGSLALSTVIAILLYRNTKRKQRIAEQEKELEIQKTTTILKEQEITTINAMIEGQEKERIRLAGDLHDNIGSTLAALKMHIGNLQSNLSTTEKHEELLEKSNQLINDTYAKVRGIAHGRNHGVMAKQGLLPAIQKLATSISSSNGLQIEVEDFGLENRLSNHLEITIFRIIQELITNIVKHANATEASISLTQYDDELNIIVEDNGRGFKVGKLEDKDGMGLGSIERRVEHLEGTMQVDSTPGKGTNILIDIPL